VTAGKLAVVTGASSGLGYELARRAVEDGYALIICADEPEIEEAADRLRRLGGTVEAVEVDLAQRAGLDAFWSRIEARDIDLFFANAGRALGQAFHDQDWADIRRLIDLNIRQTTFLLHRIGGKMRARGSGRILVTGSIGGFVPGPCDAVNNGTKAYLDSLSAALRDEWRDLPISITCLMPGPTETPVFTRAGNHLAGSGVAADEKDDPVMVARAGYGAMMAGRGSVVPGNRSKAMAMLAGIAPQSLLARLHRSGAEPRP
jgi:uncharacterized protein